LEVFRDGFPEKKLQLVGMSILISPIKPWAGMSQRGHRISFKAAAEGVVEASTTSEWSCEGAGEGLPKWDKPPPTWAET
jgi:hypothetical protein